MLITDITAFDTFQLYWLLEHILYPEGIVKVFLLKNLVTVLSGSFMFQFTTFTSISLFLSRNKESDILEIFILIK